MCADVIIGVVIGKTTAYCTTVELQRTKEYMKADYSLRAKSQTSSRLLLVCTGKIMLKMEKLPLARGHGLLSSASWTLRIIAPAEADALCRTTCTKANPAQF